MSRSQKIQNATAAEAARLRTIQEKDARRAKSAAGQSSSREMRREIDDAQTGGRKKAANKSRAGGHSPAEAGRGSVKRPLDFEEEEAEPRRRISGGNTRRVSGASGSRGDAGASRSAKWSPLEVVSEEEEEEEEEATKLGKKAESTASDSEDELQREPSPKKTKKTKKKEGGEEDDKGSKRRTQNFLV
jgi:hypothetical protein